MVANAIAHRSYLDESCTQVSIYDDRVEVSSPGMLYGGLDIETAKQGKSRCRNSAIAEAFHYMHIIEAWGTGIPRIINRCKEYGLKEPVFEEFGDGFRVTMFRKIAIGDGKEEATSQKSNKISQKMNGTSPNMASEFEKYLSLLEKANITKKYIANIQEVFNQYKLDEPFSQGNVKQLLDCSVSKATNIMQAMRKADIVEKTESYGKYKFIKL